MRRVYSTALAMAITFMPAIAGAQAAMEASTKVAGGGISAAGWAGKIDAKEVAQGQVLANSKLAMDGKDLHVTTGPAVTYWNPANKASGDYTVKALFKEPKYMNLNDHPVRQAITPTANALATTCETGNK